MNSLFAYLKNKDSCPALLSALFLLLFYYFIMAGVLALTIGVVTMVYLPFKAMESYFLRGNDLGNGI